MPYSSLPKTRKSKLTDRLCSCSEGIPLCSIAQYWFLLEVVVFQSGTMGSCLHGTILIISVYVCVCVFIYLHVAYIYISVVYIYLHTHNVLKSVFRNSKFLKLNF